MNTMKIGDPVELRSRTIRWLVKNLGLLYFKPNSQELEPQYLEEVTVILSAFLKKASLPRGKILKYGATVDGSRERYVIVSARNKIGKIECMALLERDVVKLKK